MNKIIGTSNFVKRQTPESRFTHYKGTWGELEDLTLKHFAQNKPSPSKIGVTLVPVPADGFFMKGPFTVDSQLEAKFAPRAEGEDPVLQIINHDEKIPCNFVDIVLYRHDVLAEDDDRSTDAEWEIVSINGKQSNEEQPIPPVTMARNFLHKKGGTQVNYTAKEFAESIWHYKGKEQ